MQSSPPLPAATSGERAVLDTPDGALAYYRAGPDDAAAPHARVPLLLVHSVNAAASAYEVRPLFERYRATRPVYAPDLPGFGHSSRADVAYTPRHMTDAVLAMVDEIARRHGRGAIDVVGVSLGCEFVARAAVEHRGAFRTVALVSATGVDRRAPYDGPPGSTRGKAWLYRAFARAPWSDAFFRLLTKRATIRFFLVKTFGSKRIDEGLLDYDVLTTRQPGASHAPFRFVSGFLFSADITRVYLAVDAPVFVPHGTRGDFVDYSGLPALVAERGWTEHAMDAGALPYFERLDAFADAYDRWVADRVR